MKVRLSNLGLQLRLGSELRLLILHQLTDWHSASLKIFWYATEA